MSEIDNFKNYLNQVTSMDDHSFNLAKPYFQVEKINKGDYLVTEGQKCNKILYINEGLFRIFYLKDGIEINTCFCKEQSITSSFKSFINQIPSTDYIQALENSVVVSLSAENLSKLQNQSPIWQSIRQLLTEKECLRLYDRATSLSFESALEKYKNLLNFNPEIIQRVSVQHIASYIGVSRETLSRIRSQIRD